MSDLAFCPRCGMERQPGMGFCGRCGYQYEPGYPGYPNPSPVIPTGPSLAPPKKAAPVLFTIVAGAAAFVVGLGAVMYLGGQPEPTASTLPVAVATSVTPSPLSSTPGVSAQPSASRYQPSTPPPGSTGSPSPTSTPVRSLPATPAPTPEPATCDTGGDVDASLQALQTLLMEEAVDDKYANFTKAKAAAKKPSYKTFFRNNEAYQDDPLYFRGEVIQVLFDQPWGAFGCEDTSPLLDGTATVLRVNVTRDSYGFYKDTVYVEYLGGKRVLEDDIIQLAGMGIGLETYESTTGGTITIPSVVVGKYLIIQGG